MYSNFGIYLTDDLLDIIREDCANMVFFSSSRRQTERHEKKIPLEQITPIFHWRSVCRRELLNVMCLDIPKPINVTLRKAPILTSQPGACFANYPLQ